MVFNIILSVRISYFQSREQISRSRSRRCGPSGWSRANRLAPKAAKRVARKEERRSEMEERRP